MLENMNLSGTLYDVRVLEAMRNIRIEDFITMDMIETFIPTAPNQKRKMDEDLIKMILLQLFAAFYSNRPLLFYNDPIYGRSTSAPHMIAIMAQLIEVEENDKVLVLGSKSGYLESIIQDMDKNIQLYIMEKVHEIYNITETNLKRIDAGEKVKIFELDPILDLEKLDIDIFDKIFITGYMKELPDVLKKKVKIGGLICGPFGGKNTQTLIRYFKTGEDMFDEEDCGSVIFSPLITDYKN
ncbi:MAG: hypothetical protein GF364_12390 [Candidatus Lokiarchaeota archaeon]|nr:hypothetical protein [Candidatus Lokiarchaeota archaeon]